MKICSTAVHGEMEQNQVVLQTKLGKLRGYTRQSVFSDKTYYAFQGIPYAKPPLGKLRFKAPQPFGSWEGVRDALKDGNSCKQRVMLPRPGMDPNQISEGDEDCLYLYVYMNELPSSGTKKPVMFSIHGGAFAGGSGGLDSMGPDNVLEGDVVFVSINYRCGPFGFLSLNTSEVPGNAGLKDQACALQWVHDNIESFGGDPDNITIFGISAGGASVHLMMLSPMTKGLFHKAIIQSGFAQNPWAIQREPRENALNLAKALGCSSGNSHEILETLQSASADDIIRAIVQAKSKELMNMNLFTPSVEVSGTTPFLADTPSSIMKKGEFNKVPVILGACGNEGGVVSFFNGVSDEVNNYINKHPVKLVPSFLELKSGSIEEKEAQEAIWDFYFKGKPLAWDNFSDYLSYQSDCQFNIGMFETRNSLLEKSSMPVYRYSFTNHSHCIMCFIVKHAFSQQNNLKGLTAETCHGADCLFLYKLNLLPVSGLTPELKKAVIKHIKAWTTFAAVGDPNCKELGAAWERDSESKPCFMEIGTEWTLQEGFPFADRLAFWKKLISKYSTAED